MRNKRGLSTALENEGEGAGQSGGERKLQQEERKGKGKRIVSQPKASGVDMSGGLTDKWNAHFRLVFHAQMRRPKMAAVRPRIHGNFLNWEIWGRIRVPDGNGELPWSGTGMVDG